MDKCTGSQTLDWNPAHSLPATFTELPYQIYADDPHWIPENTASVRLQFSEQHEFFQSNSAWVGVIDGQTRLAGFFEPSHRINGEAVCYFGFWETENNLAANRDLFSVLETWAREKGAKVLYGPINFNTYQSNRIKLDAFDDPSFQGEPRNPSYYPAMLTDLGFKLHYRYFTHITRDIPALANLLKPGYDAFVQRNASVKLKTLTPEIWMENLDYLYDFVDHAFSDNFGYRKISKAQFISACGEPFANKMCTKSSVVAMDEQDGIKGFFIAYPNYSELLRSGANNTLNEKQIQFSQHFDLLSLPKTVLAKTVAVDPNYRGGYLFSAMSYWLTREAAKSYECLNGAMVREDNPSAIVSGRMPESKTYGLFSKRLDSNENAN